MASERYVLHLSRDAVALKLPCEVGTLGLEVESGVLKRVAMCGTLSRWAQTPFVIRFCRIKAAQVAMKDDICQPLD